MHGEIADSGQNVIVVTLRKEDPLHVTEHVVRTAATEYQSPPRHPQGDAERSLIGAVTRYVPDQQSDGPVGKLDPVEEIAAEQRPLSARAVACRPPQGRVGDDGTRQQPALQSVPLGGHQLDLTQPAVGILAEFPLDAYRMARVNPSASTDPFMR